MKEESKNAIILAVLLFTTGFLALFSIYYKGYLLYNGVAVDREGNVYIGTDSEIDVYDNNSQFLYRITRLPRAYNFTLWNDRLYLRAPDYVSIRTKSGELIERIYYSENDNLPDYMRYTYNGGKQPFVSEDGDVYKLLKIDGLRLSVMKNGDTVVYIESWTPAILRFLLTISGISTAGFLIFLAVESEMIRSAQKSSDKNKESK